MATIDDVLGEYGVKTTGAAGDKKTTPGSLDIDAILKQYNVVAKNAAPSVTPNEPYSTEGRDEYGRPLGPLGPASPSVESGSIPHAMARGAAEAWGGGPGLTEQQTQTLRNAGVFPNPLSATPLQRLNQIVVPPLWAAGDLPLRAGAAGLRGVQEGVIALGRATGYEGLARDVAALPEAFPTMGMFRARPPGTAAPPNPLASWEPSGPGRATPPQGLMFPGTPESVAPTFVPPGTPIPTLERIRQLINEDNRVAINRPDFVPPNAAQPPNPLSTAALTPSSPLSTRVAEPLRIAGPEPRSIERPSQPIPNGLTPEQVAEFQNIPEHLPPQIKEIRTAADAASRADEIINHFASIGNRTPIEGAEGALPTITGNSGLATLYRAVRSADTPVPFTVLEKAAKDKAGAALAEMVRDKPALEAGEAAREVATEPLRTAAFANKTEANPAPVVSKIQEILNSPSGMSDAVKLHLKSVLTKLVDKDGNILDRAKDPEQLYGLDKAIRKDISPLAAGTTSDAKLAAHELMQVQDALRPVINDAAPGFDAYMAKYSELSRSLDEMRYLQSRNLTNVMDETTLGKLHGMMTDINKQRNASGIKLPDSLSPETLDKLSAIHRQMQLEHGTMTGGKDLGSNTFQNFATNTMIGRLAGHATNALTNAGIGLLTDLAVGGGGGGGALAGSALAVGAKTLSENQALKAAARQEMGQRLLMKELRDRLLNIDNKGIRALNAGKG